MQNSKINFSGLNMDALRKVRNKQEYEQKRQLLREAKQLFEESERVLNILRTASSARIPEPTDEEVLQWHSQITVQQ